MELLRNIPRRSRKRIGRGGKRGTYSGRGVKGQRARAGTHKYNAKEEYVKTFPKLRGVTFRPLNRKPVAVDVSLLDAFEAGSVVTRDELARRGIIRKGEQPKLLGNGPIGKKLTVQRIPVSKQAKAAIEHAGGAVA